jgi:hypothetical protein
MKFITKRLGRYTIGIWIALLAMILALLAWVMQTYSLLDWEGALELGLQNESFNGDLVEQALADVERGVALADIFWALPITIIAVIGLLRKSLLGFVAAMMVFAICVYFPLVFAFHRWDSHMMTALTALILFAIPALLGMIGLWTNRKLFKS